MDQRMESVVRIHSKEEFIGTGFLVHHSHDAGFVMTCRHVIDEFLEFQGALRIFFPNGNRFDDVAIVKEDESADLALLRYPDSTTSGSPEALQISPPGAYYVGPVELIGYFSSDATVPIRPGISTGLIIGEPTIPRNPDYTKPLCNISNETSKGGTSGSPLMSCEEKVIGVHTVQGAGIKYSIMAKDIYSTLQKWSKATKDGIAIRDMLTMIATDTATASSSAPTATTSYSKH